MSTKKILIPVDFSTELEVIFGLLKNLKEDHPLEVTLLHHMQFPVIPGNYMQPMDYLGEFYHEHMQLHEKHLNEIAARPEFEGITVNAELVADPNTIVGEDIATYANDRDVDLVVLVSKHRKGMETVYPGTELMRIIRHCTKPMLVLSPGHHARTSRIAFATDFSELSAEAFKQLEPVAKLLGGTVNCFRINTAYEFIDQREFVSSRNEFSNHLGITDVPDIDLYNAWEADMGILQYAEDNMADVIALATHARKGLNRIFNPSITEKVLRATMDPILILNLHSLD